MVVGQGTLPVTELAVCLPRAVGPMRWQKCLGLGVEAQTGRCCWSPGCLGSLGWVLVYRCLLLLASSPVWRAGLTQGESGLS